MERRVLLHLGTLLAVMLLVVSCARIDPVQPTAQEGVVYEALFATWLRARREGLQQSPEPFRVFPKTGGYKEILSRDAEWCLWKNQHLLLAWESRELMEDFKNKLGEPRPLSEMVPNPQSFVFAKAKGTSQSDATYYISRVAFDSGKRYALISYHIGGDTILSGVVLLQRVGQGWQVVGR